MFLNVSNVLLIGKVNIPRPNIHSFTLRILPYLQPEVQMAQPRPRFVDLESYTKGRQKMGPYARVKQVEIGAALDPKA